MWYVVVCTQGITRPSQGHQHFFSESMSPVVAIGQKPHLLFHKWMLFFIIQYKHVTSHNLLHCDMLWACISAIFLLCWGAFWLYDLGFKSNKINHESACYSFTTKPIKSRVTFLPWPSGMFVQSFTAIRHCIHELRHFVQNGPLL